ncbi:hypothetical protein CHLRE_03g174550v5 [Chlamydomonas reinhardtii]|uniref:Uncharacterized protein n=1 Tax=Chlamydomonas reinhardtii TaxID=3055 RepID=A0A2K3DXA4_CHLRE|nr:uncharacterized protein CHLRE_03g174550v5 [Chlamydomonas reinhardtii]PNW85169.1 hypothetical protein CHLRE_03g174550v5 [Chlamydomonas reinhardtii]
MVGSVFTRIIPSNLLGTRVGNASILRGKLHNFRLVGMDGNLIPADAFGAGVTPVWMMTLVAYSDSAAGQPGSGGGRGGPGGGAGARAAGRLTH